MPVPRTLARSYCLKGSFSRVPIHRCSGRKFQMFGSPGISEKRLFHENECCEDKLDCHGKRLRQWLFDLKWLSFRWMIIQAACMWRTKGLNGKMSHETVQPLSYTIIWTKWSTWRNHYDLSVYCCSFVNDFPLRCASPLFVRRNVNDSTSCAIHIVGPCLQGTLTERTPAPHFEQYQRRSLATNQIFLACRSSLVSSMWSNFPVCSYKKLFLLVRR